MKYALLILAIFVTACDAGEATETIPTDIIWTLTTLDGAPFDASATLNVSQEGTVTGRAPCNRFSAKLVANHPEFNLGPILSTKVACPDLQKEQQFFAALARVTTADISPGRLTLSDANGGTMIFTADD